MKHPKVKQFAFESIGEGITTKHNISERVFDKMEEINIFPPLSKTQREYLHGLVVLGFSMQDLKDEELVYNNGVGGAACRWYPPAQIAEVN